MCSEMWSRWAVATFEGRTVAVHPQRLALAEGYNITLYEGNQLEETARWTLEKPARRLRFNSDTSIGLTATDRAGRVSLLLKNAPPQVLADPPGLILDAIVHNDKLITCDRDEKVRIARFPNTLDILSYLLAHEEYVCCIQPIDNKLASASGDGSVKIWDLTTNLKPIDLNISDQQDETPWEGNGKRPVHRLSLTSSALVIARLNSSYLFIYQSEEPYKRLQSIKLSSPPLDIATDNNDIYVTLSIDNKPHLQLWSFDSDTLKLIEDKELEGVTLIANPLNEVTPLFKKKVDGVADYAERKRKRIQEKDSS